MARVCKRLRSQVLPRELEDKGLENSPEYDPHEDETQTRQMFSQLTEELEHTPEAGDHYIGAEILLSRGDELARGHVLAWNHDTNGNMMSRAHMNLILDIRIYHTAGWQLVIYVHETNLFYILY